MRNLVVIGLLVFGFLFGGGEQASALIITDTTTFNATGTTDDLSDLIASGGDFVNKFEYGGDFVFWKHQFTPSLDIITGSIALTLRDDERDSILPWTWEFAFGYGEDGNWGIGEVDSGIYSFDLAVTSLTDGEYKVKLKSLGGDFYLDKSELTIEYSAAPVPEPATLILLGAGLLGLAAWGRKSRK